MRERAAGRIRVGGNYDNAFGLSGRLRPGQWRRNVAAGAGVFLRNRLAIGKRCALDLQLRVFPVGKLRLFTTTGQQCSSK